MTVDETLKDNEVGCYTCSRYGLDSVRCKWCKNFSEWQGVEEVNKHLIAAGLTPYSCAEEMRVHNIYGVRAWIRYRAAHHKE